MQMWTSKLSKQKKLTGSLDQFIWSVFSVRFGKAFYSLSESLYRDEVCSSCFVLQAYGRDLMEAQDWCRKYMRSGNVKDLTQAWDLYYHVFRRISKQLPQVSGLESTLLSTLKPRLQTLNQTNVVDKTPLNSEGSGEMWAPHNTWRNSAAAECWTEPWCCSKLILFMCRVKQNANFSISLANLSVLYSSKTAQTYGETEAVTSAQSLHTDCCEQSSELKSKTLCGCGSLVLFQSTWVV